MTVYLLATYDGPTEMLSRPGVGTLATNLRPLFSDPDNKFRADMVTQVVQDAIIDTVGLDAFFRRYSKFLRDKPKMTPQVLTICVHCLAFICVASTLDI